MTGKSSKHEEEERKECYYHCLRLVELWKPHYLWTNGKQLFYCHVFCKPELTYRKWVLHSGAGLLLELAPPEELPNGKWFWIAYDMNGDKTPFTGDTRDDVIQQFTSKFVENE